MVRRKGAGPAGVLWRLVFVTAALAPAHAVLISKCCPSDRILSAQLDDCVPHNSSKGMVSQVTEEPVASLRARSADFPWWMDSEVALYGSMDSNVSVRSFLADQPADAKVMYRVWPQCEALETLHIATTRRDLYRLLSNGSLAVALSAASEESQEYVMLDPETGFCADVVDAVVHGRPVYVFLTCPCSRALCINKCCGSRMLQENIVGQSVVTSRCRRNNVNDPWEPTFYAKPDAEPVENVSYILMPSKYPKCGGKSEAVSLNAEKDTPLKMWLLADGSALVQNFGRGDEAVAREDFCGDWLLKDDGTVMENLVFCAPKREDEGPTAVRAFYGSLYGVTAAFLLLTLIVFLLVPDLRTSPHAKAVMSHVAALFVACLPAVHGQVSPLHSGWFCLVSAFVEQFAFLAAFFWLNVMCVYISWAFSPFRSLVSGFPHRDRRKFMLFSIYAWGSPAVITVITVVMQFVENLPDTLIRPEIGIKSCWFRSTAATLLFFYGPMALLMLVNMGLFIYASWRVLQVRRDRVELYKGQDPGSSATRDRKWFIMYVKLFLLMGTTWVMEIVSWIEGSDLVLWYITDFINLLRGVLIFAMFCCKPLVWQQLRQCARDWREGRPGCLGRPRSGTGSRSRGGVGGGTLDSHARSSTACTRQSTLPSPGK